MLGDDPRVLSLSLPPPSPQSKPGDVTYDSELSETLTVLQAQSDDSNVVACCVFFIDVFVHKPRHHTRYVSHVHSSEAPYTANKIKPRYYRIIRHCVVHRQLVFDNDVLCFCHVWLVCLSARLFKIVWMKFHDFFGMDSTWDKKRSLRF